MSVRHVFRRVAAIVRSVFQQKELKVKRLEAAILRAPIRMLLLACAAIVLIPPTVAWATNYNYASGTGGCCGTFPGPGWNSYTLNEVWHSTGSEWEVYYDSSSGHVGDVADYNNPTQWPHSIGYGWPYCHNINDYGPVSWTCQYGQ